MVIGLDLSDLPLLIVHPTGFPAMPIMAKESTMPKEVIRKTTPEAVRTTSSTTPKRFLRLPEAMKKCGVGRAWIYSAMNEERFPQSVKLGERSIAWLESELDAWIDSRIASRG
jgi:prophage regulatory protein